MIFKHASRCTYCENSDNDSENIDDNVESHSSSNNNDLDNSSNDVKIE